MIFPQSVGLFDCLCTLQIKSFCIKVNFIQSHQYSLISFVLFRQNQPHKVIFVFIDEVENETSPFLEFD
jgi:hypothetical protein